MLYKTCKKCLIEKTLENFHKNRNSRLNICKICRNAERKEEYAQDEILREEIKQKQRQYNTENQDKIKESNNKYYEKNKVTVLQNASSYYLLNKEKIKESRKEKRDSINAVRQVYNKINSEKLKAQSKVWRLNNRDKLTKNQAKRIANQKRATPVWVENEWESFCIEEIYNLSKRYTEILGREFNVDHIVPLTSEDVCGLHCMANMQILEKSENISKGNRHWPDMW